ncbi:hypothetical protein ACFX2A_046929 [Malus domestica]
MIGPGIVSFDLGEEKFHHEVVPLPSVVVDGGGECYGYDSIWTNGNSLFLYTHVIKRRKFEIWETTRKRPFRRHFICKRAHDHCEFSII